MGKRYFQKSVKYIKRVYDIQDGLSQLEDKRVNPTYPGSRMT
jgi:hypothetical protein